MTAFDQAFAAKTNPANSRGITAENRIPLSVPQTKLSAPEIPGYHTHWFLDKPDRIEAALRAGYEFVDKEETAVNNHDVAGDRAERAGTDLGSRVSIVAGPESGRLILMKLRNEWRAEDMKLREGNAGKLVDALRRGTASDSQQPGADLSNRYSKPENRNIFTRRT